MLNFQITFETLCDDINGDSELIIFALECENQWSMKIIFFVLNF